MLWYDMDALLKRCYCISINSSPPSSMLCPDHHQCAESLSLKITIKTITSVIQKKCPKHLAKAHMLGVELLIHCDARVPSPLGTENIFNIRPSWWLLAFNWSPWYYFGFGDLKMKTKSFHEYGTTHHIMMSLSSVWHIAGPFSLTASLNEKNTWGFTYGLFSPGRGKWAKCVLFSFFWSFTVTKRFDFLKFSQLF